MSKKTVARRGAKWWPLTVEARALLDAEDASADQVPDDRPQARTSAQSLAERVRAGLAAPVGVPSDTTAVGGSSDDEIEGTATEVTDTDSTPADPPAQAAAGEGDGQAGAHGDAAPQAPTEEPGPAVQQSTCGAPSPFTDQDACVLAKHDRKAPHDDGNGNQWL